jgi:hypothetical protein
MDVHAARNILEEARIANSIYVTLINGLSAIHCARGEYPEAEVAATKAYRLSVRLDHEYLAKKAATNASVATGRQGHYHDQEKWGRLALGEENRTGNDSRHMRAAVCVAEARAMRWERDSLQVYNQLMPHPGSGMPPWEAQAGMLNEADLNQLLGNPKQAMELGRRATTGRNARPLSRGWTGKFARWLTLTSLSGENTGEAQKVITVIASNIEKYDALDRVEIACCLVALSEAWSPHLEEITDQARVELSKLPPAVSERLERLGMLRYLGGRQP